MKRFLLFLGVALCATFCVNEASAQIKLGENGTYENVELVLLEKRYDLIGEIDDLEDSSLHLLYYLDNKNLKGFKFFNIHYDINPL